VEFDLLSVLSTTPGKVYTRADLIDRVWGAGFRITDRTIDSHIKSLRRKVVDAGGDANWIETVRGVNYCLSESDRVAGSPATGSSAP
jgi:two-component system catabolic regulation response regulator CreB